jgi:hypothetical protein
VNGFSLWTLASVSAVSVCGLVLGSASMNWLDRLTLSVVALVPLYVFPAAVIWLWPDYLALNIALVVLTVALFQWEWGRDRGSWIRCAVYGVLAGSIAANKISMVVIAAPLVVLAATHHATVKTTIARAGIAGISAVLALAVWLGAAGLFQMEWLRALLPKWLAVINMGPEAGFTAWPYLWRSYALTVLWFAVALLVAATGMGDRRTYAVGAMTLVSALLCIVAIWKRPAGTTVSDTALVLLGLGGMLFTFSKRSIASVATIAAGALAFIGAAMLSERPSIMHAVIAGSQPSGDEQWKFFELVKQKGAGREIVYFVPDNHHQHGDVFMLLLKGASDFGTWNVGDNGAAFLQRLGVNIAFVSGPDVPIETSPSGKLFVWINATGLRDVEDHYPLLTDAANGRGTTHDVIELPHTAAIGHIVRMP